MGNVNIVGLNQALIVSGEIPTFCRYIGNSIGSDVQS